ncbi:hypothetical protein ACHAXH_009124 [Discostella pseudostelligera]
MVTRKFHAPLVLLCHLHLVAIVSAQTTPSSTLCLSAPCEFVGECRDKYNTCGDTTAHCNSESIWVPACGGGGGIYKPSTGDTAVSSPAPAPALTYSTPPILMPTTTNTMKTQQTDTAQPTTAWESWMSEDTDGGVIGLTTGHEGEGNYTQSNGTDSWFNGDTWQNGRNVTEEESLIDKIDFWDNSDSSGSNMGAMSLFSMALLFAMPALF